uniref:Uncharacterized protein n=1 Tax=Arundo donax TaxID=35708 RepID=A0A0A9AIY1_ARUDO
MILFAIMCNWLKCSCAPFFCRGRGWGSLMVRFFSKGAVLTSHECATN